MMVVVNHHHDDDDTDKGEACISFLNSLFFSLSLTPRSIISVVLSVNVLLIISVVCVFVCLRKSVCCCCKIPFFLLQA